MFAIRANYKKTGSMSTAPYVLQVTGCVLRVAGLSIADLGLWISDLRDWLDSRYRMLD